LEVQRKGNENGICKIVGVGYRDLCGMRKRNGLFSSLPRLPNGNNGRDIRRNGPIGFDINGPYGAPFVYKRKGKDIMVYSLIAVAVFVSGGIAVPMFCMGIALIYTSLRNDIK